MRGRTCSSGGRLGRTMNEAHMKRAVALSTRGIELGHGGPFGAVVVAIRNACRKLATYDLSGCEIYSSCEPCPMCLGAINWSRIGRVYFAVNRHAATDIEFRDAFIYEELAKPFDKRALSMVHVPCDGALDVFDAWTRLAGRVTY